MSIKNIDVCIFDAILQQEVPKILKEIIEPIYQENHIKEPEQGQTKSLKQTSSGSEPQNSQKKMNFSEFDETDEDIPVSNSSESAPTSDERVIIAYIIVFRNIRLRCYNTNFGILFDPG